MKKNTNQSFKKKNQSKKSVGGQLSLPDAGTFNFAGSNIGSWTNGLGVPVVLVGLRELMKGSKKKQNGGDLSLPGAGTFNFSGSDLSSWANGIGAPVVLVGLRELMKGSKKKQNGGDLSLPDRKSVV